MVDLHDTIVALATAHGPGGRAILRLSGADSVRVAATTFVGDGSLDGDRRLIEGVIRLPDLASPIPAMMLMARGPRSYTGQDVVELHLISSPPLVDRVMAACLDAGARAARAGEFTMRAFLAGKLDLTAAEAVLGVVEANHPEELKSALAQLAGGLSRPLETLRSSLLDLLADVEAGLDFADEDLEFVGQEQLLHRLALALAQVTVVERQLTERARSDAPFRVVLAGPANAGKSSLFNAMVGRPAALVSPTPGTTRDYVVHRERIGDLDVEWIDTAGLGPSRGTVDSESQRQGQERWSDADLILWCRPTDDDGEARPDLPAAAVRVATKCDLGSPCEGEVATSAVRGEGIAELRSLVMDRSKERRAGPMAPSLGRCRHHVAACLEHLRRAHSAVLYADPSEIVALELRGSLDELGEMVGAVYTDDLLDRIFSRFCIGK